MRFMVAADTDVGISRETNQDSVMVKHAECREGEVLLAAICDGMGGLSKGELASATVITEFSKWFDEELPYEMENIDLNILSSKWSWMLQDLNIRLLRYGQRNGASLGTTFTGILMVKEDYMIVHVGDTRIYRIDNQMNQLTTDQTFVAREIQKGTMTVVQAENDKRRNMLLQCVGASDRLEPEVIIGKCEKGAYLICSDGFRHEIADEEIYESVNPINLVNKKAMKSNIRYLIDENKRRQEKDNISAILIKVC